jgi:hypothetical protein
VEYRGIRYTVRARIERDGHVSLTCPGKKSRHFDVKRNCIARATIPSSLPERRWTFATELKLAFNENAKPRLPVDSDPDPRYNLITIEQR